MHKNLKLSYHFSCYYLNNHFCFTHSSSCCFLPSTPSFHFFCLTPKPFTFWHSLYHLGSWSIYYHLSTSRSYWSVLLLHSLFQFILNIATKVFFSKCNDHVTQIVYVTHKIQTKVVTAAYTVSWCAVPPPPLSLFLYILLWFSALQATDVILVLQTQQVRYCL